MLSLSSLGFISSLAKQFGLEPAIGNNRSWALCWQASTHGWAGSTFHSRCNGKNHTITIIKKDQYVFGGYTDVPWGKGVFLVGERRRGGGGAALFLLLLIINRRLTETRTYSACIPLFYSGIKSLLQLNIANLDATRSFVFVLKSRFCKWRALISQHFCQAFSQKTK